jgi:hypothetical protein
VGLQVFPEAFPSENPDIEIRFDPAQTYIHLGRLDPEKYTLSPDDFYSGHKSAFWKKIRKIAVRTDGIWKLGWVGHLGWDVFWENHLDGCFNNLDMAKVELKGGSYHVTSTNSLIDLQCLFEEIFGRRERVDSR